MANTYSIPTTYAIKQADFVLDGEREYVLKIRDLPPDEKPREKLIAHGPGMLSVAELLAVIFGVGTPKEDVLKMSSRLLKEYGEKALLNQKDPAKIAESLDIPLLKACQLVACFEVGRRFFKTPAGKPEFLRTAKQVSSYLNEMKTLPKEHLRGIYLNSHYRMVHDEVISIGSINANIIHPREVFRPALEYSASAVILAHNHPSGITKASDADVKITNQLIEAGKILGIHLLDHIILTKDGFSSVPANYD